MQVYHIENAHIFMYCPCGKYINMCDNVSSAGPHSKVLTDRLDKLIKLNVYKKNKLLSQI